MNYAEKAFLYSTMALTTMFAQGCKKTNDPTLKVDPVQKVEDVILRVNADPASSIEFVAVINPGVKENDAQGLGYIYDLNLFQSSFKAATTPDPVIPDINEAFTMKVNEDNIMENNSKTKLQLIKTDEVFALITPDDGSFFKNNKWNVIGLEVRIPEDGITTENLKRNLTSKQAFVNSGFNLASKKFNRTLHIVNPTTLSPVPSATRTTTPQ
jgi:hypothetical protein